MPTPDHPGDALRRAAEDLRNSNAALYEEVILPLVETTERAAALATIVAERPRNEDLLSTVEQLVLELTYLSVLQIRTCQALAMRLDILENPDVHP
jgi:hypothetical protein